MFLVMVFHVTPSSTSIKFILHVITIIMEETLGVLLDTNLRDKTYAVNCRDDGDGAR
jgi:hypothetical protein